MGRDKVLKRALLAAIPFFILLALPLFFFSNQVAAQSVGDSCTGEVSGIEGTCALLCGPTRQRDGWCGIGVQCCVDEDKLPGIGTVCTGESSGEIGSCQVICGSGTPDGNTGCSPGQSCCIGLPNVGGQAESPLEGGDCESDELYTAIGCIPIGNPDDFLGFILSWTLGIAGGIAFLMIIYSGFQIVTSSGDPRKLEAGKELLTAAIGGLLLILFSAFILDLVGVDILKIPGFG